MRRFMAALAATLLLIGPAAMADTESPAPELGSDDPALQQRVTADEAMGEERVVLEAGHVDLGPRFIDGEWTLLARDDTAALTDGAPVWRRTDDVVFQISDAAKMALPDDPTYAFTGGKPGDEVWAVPQSEITDVVWLGWNTQDPQVVESIDRGVTLQFLEAKHVDGDGRMTLFLQPGNFAPPQMLFDGTTAADVWVDLNTHTHANWVFTQPGTFLVRLAAVGQGVDGTEHRSEATLRFSIGASADPDAAFAAAWPDEPASASPTPSASTEASPDASPTAEQPGAPAAEGTAGPSWRPWAIGVGAFTVVVGIIVVWMGRRTRRVEAEVFGANE